MSQRKSPQVAGLMLAAGFSRRFGADKRHAELPDGQRLLNASVAAAQTQLQELWLVLREHDDAAALGVPSSANLVFSKQAVNGMGCSLADGVAALAAQSRADAVAVLLGDMPWIQPATLALLMAKAAAERIVVPTYRGEPGHPVIFGRHFWPELKALSGDSGAKVVLQANAQAVLRVEVSDAGILRDVDTPAALG